MPPFTVQYRCLYRDYWFDDEASAEYWDTASALRRAIELLETGRRVRIADQNGDTTEVLFA